MGVVLAVAVVGEEFGGRIMVVQVMQDGDGFGKGIAVDHQRGDLAAGIFGEIFRAFMFALEKINQLRIVIRVGFVERDHRNPRAGAGEEIEGQLVHGLVLSSQR